MTLHELAAETTQEFMTVRRCFFHGRYFLSGRGPGLVKANAQVWFPFILTFPVRATETPTRRLAAAHIVVRQMLIGFHEKDSSVELVTITEEEREGDFLAVFTIPEVHQPASVPEEISPEPAPEPEPEGPVPAQIGDALTFAPDETFVFEPAAAEWWNKITTSTGQILSKELVFDLIDRGEVTATGRTESAKIYSFHRNSLENMQELYTQVSTWLRAAEQRTFRENSSAANAHSRKLSWLSRRVQTIAGTLSEYLPEQTA